MSDIKKFDYQGQPITFEFADGNKMINATQMAKPFGKRVSNFLRLDTTSRYVELLESRYSDVSIGQKSQKREVLRVIKGGTPEMQGTWMDEKLALKFAAWLSPEFELWVYDRIEELLTTGRTTVSQVRHVNFAKALRLLAEQWEQQERINEGFRAELDYTAERLAEIEAKIATSDEEYYTVKGYCSLHGILCPDNKARSWGKQATSMSVRLGYTVGKAYDMKWGEVNAYHQDILAKIIK